VIFQILDDKKSCVGFYTDGKIQYQIPQNLTATWKWAPIMADVTRPIKYAYFYTNGAPIEDVCPPHLKEEFDAYSKKMKAFLRSFKLAKVNLNDNCFFDLVPSQYLLKYCAIKNEITQHVLQNYEYPKAHGYYIKLTDLIHKISQQDLNLKKENFTPTDLMNRQTRNFYSKLDEMPRRIKYEIFGGKGGRLRTSPDSFKIFALNRDYRKVIVPQNDFFLELDYNGDHLRAMLGLARVKQPKGDIHAINAKKIFGGITRDAAKRKFWKWAYNENNTHKNLEAIYKRAETKEKYFDGEHITTIFGRKLKATPGNAFNYIIQSTANDILCQKAIDIGVFLENKKSFISFLLHDSIVFDMSADDKKMVNFLISLFSDTRFGKYKVNAKMGTSFGTMVDYDGDDSRFGKSWE
tara:strand:- start:139 stop:1359 length:1221 start_codon:yes stop_codon:yes gene_type:complete